MRVLIATPVYQLYSETVAAAQLQDFAGERDHLLVSGDDMRLTHFARITAKFNRIRTQFLAGGYDALLTVEADMVPPPHALTALLATGADVAYGVYCFRHEHQGRLWNVAARLHGDGSGSWLSNNPAQARALWGEVVRCAGVGTGCTLIRRPVLEALAFRDDGRLHHDWWFATDAAQLGFTQVAHLGVPCGHIQDRDRALWPDPDCSDLSRLERL